jgi:Cu2+-exporting ATPase
MFFMNMPFANEIMWVLSTPVLFWLGRDFYINAWKQAKHRSANMDTLVALSTAVAYIFSVFNTLVSCNSGTKRAYTLMFILKPLL